MSYFFPLPLLQNIIHYLLNLNFVERAREAFSAKIEKNIKKKNKEGDSNDVEEIENAKKLQKVANIQARSAKNKMKPKKLKAVPDFGQSMSIVLFYFKIFLMFKIFHR